MNPPITAYDSATGHPLRWQVLAIMCTCLILVVAGVSSLNIAVPSIIGDLNPSNTELLWIIDAYALVFAGLLLPAGALGDRYGRKGALLVGLAIFAAGAIWSATAGSPTELIIARGSMGIGAALVMPATLSILVAVFPVSERAKRLLSGLDLLAPGERSASSVEVRSLRSSGGDRCSSSTCQSHCSQR